MDPTETQGAAPAAAPATDAAPDGAQTVVAARSDEPLFNKQEIVELKKDVRSVKKVLEELAPALSNLRTQASAETRSKATTALSQDSDLAQQVATLRRENALNRAFADHGLKPGKAREFIEKQAARLAPEDIGSFVAEYLSASTVESAAPAAKPVTVPTTAAPPAVAGKPAGDTGAPGTDGKAPITSDLSGMDREVFRSLPPEQRRKLVTEAFRRGGGGTGRDPLGLPDAWDPARAARNRTG